MFKTECQNIKEFLYNNEMYYILGGSKAFPFDIYVDDLENPTSACAFLSASYDSLDYSELTVYGENKAFLDEVYKTFVRGKKVFFCATDYSIIEYYSTKRKIRIYTKCSSVCYQYNGFPEYSCEYTLGEVKPKDYPIIVKHHQYGGTLEDTAFCAENLPNAALYDGDKLISWALVHREGSIGPLFTLPKYRGKGLAKVILASLMKKMLDRDMLPYSYIVVGNTSSEALVDKVGSKFCGRIVGWGVTK